MRRLNPCSLPSRYLLVAIAASAFSCGRNDNPKTRPLPTGDTTIVVSPADGEWGAPHVAVPVVRVRSDQREAIFGAVFWLAPRRDGGVLVYDAKGAEGKVVRAFDSAGRFERNYGREGGGPGEYNNMRVSVAEGTDGTVIVRDGSRAISRFTRDGRLLNSFALSGRENWMGLVAATNGSILTFATEPARGATRSGLATVMRYDTTGRLLDTLLPHSWVLREGRGAYSGGPRQQWQPMPDGRAVIGRSDRLAFLIVDPAGTRAPLIGEVPSAPIVLPKEAIDERRAAEEASRKLGPNPSSAIARTEQPAGYITIDADQRIWIQKLRPPVKGEPYCMVAGDTPGGDQCIVTGSYHQSSAAFVVFRSDGSFLGEVRMPDGVRGPPAAQGDFAWFMQEQPDGDWALVKFRIRKGLPGPR